MPSLRIGGPWFSHIPTTRTQLSGHTWRQRDGGKSQVCAHPNQPHYIDLSDAKCTIRESESVSCSAAAAKSLQSCPTLCDPIDGSPPGFPIPGILQARTLKWVAISFSNAWKWKVKVQSLSRVWLFATQWTAAHQAPPSMGFSRQKYWSGVPLPSPVSCSVMSKYLWPWTQAPLASLSMGILQARILVWVVFPTPGESSQPRDWTQVSHIADGFFTAWATREAQTIYENTIFPKLLCLMQSSNYLLIYFSSREKITKGHFSKLSMKFYFNSMLIRREWAEHSVLRTYHLGCGGHWTFQLRVFLMSSPSIHIRTHDQVTFILTHGIRCLDLCTRDPISIHYEIILLKILAKSIH